MRTVINLKRPITSISLDLDEASFDGYSLMQWIPVTERLPSKEEQDPNLGVLVTLGNGYKGIDFDWYHNGRWYDWNRHVIAWMPLPEPYAERRTDE